jgi:exodeoxyribonuclease VII small subunit
MASDEQEPFEAVYQRLEATVARLEAGGLTLDEMLALYEEGMQLAERCRKLLGEAELRITRLQESYSASLERFDGTAETPGDYVIVDEDEDPLE